MCVIWGFRRSRFRNDHLQAGILELSDEPGIGTRIGDQDVEVGDWANVGEALHAKFSMIGKSDSGLGRLRHHPLDLRLGMVGGRDTVLRVNGTDAENGFVQSYFRQGSLRPLSGEIKRIFLKIASGPENGDAWTPFHLTTNLRPIASSHTPTRAVLQGWRCW